jgi:magnesium-transporting ATPase (P-type)
MTVEKIYCDGIISETGTALRDSQAVQNLVKTALLCNEAGISQDGSFIGDATEVALLRLAAAMGMSFQDERQKYPKTYITVSGRLL